MGRLKLVGGKKDPAWGHTLVRVHPYISIAHILY